MAASARVWLGTTLLLQAEGDRAASMFEEGLAVVAGERGEAWRSARLFGVTEGILEEVGIPVYGYYLPAYTLYEKIRTAVRCGLGEESFAEARNEGRELAFDEAVSFAHYVLR